MPCRGLAVVLGRFLSASCVLAAAVIRNYGRLLTAVVGRACLFLMPGISLPFLFATDEIILRKEETR